MWEAAIAATHECGATDSAPLKVVAEYTATERLNVFGVRRSRPRDHGDSFTVTDFQSTR